MKKVIYKKLRKTLATKIAKTNTNYKKISELDGEVIFADEDGYFLFEHYHGIDGSYWSIPVRLGKTAKEVEEALGGINNWNYRAWHGEMDTILKVTEECRKLKDIK